MDGILLIDKPEGWTSHDVVAKVRGILKSATGRKIKIGHTGTLDPMATGLLILVVGGYTKKAQDYSKLDKIYKAELTLGAVSTTGDKEGKITAESTKEPSLKEIEDALNRFKGEIMQTPHKFSAIKVGGRKAYDAARKGQDLKLEPRPVTIHEIKEVDYDYPMLKFTAKVSSGTYIRSLAEDIGEALGTGAYLSALRRAQVDKFDIQGALKIDDLTGANIENSLQK